MYKVNQNNIKFVKMYRRSMNGRIYQQKTFRPKSIKINNPQQRSLQYPIKGDTSFEPEQHGKKHYLSPRHSAIHSIIFNQDYDSLIKEKRDLIDKINSSRNTHRFDQKLNKQKIQGFNNQLNGKPIQENRLNNHYDPFSPYNNYNSQPGFDSYAKIAKGYLFRQGSMNQVLKPYSGPIERQELIERNSSMYQTGHIYTPYQNYEKKPKINSIIQTLSPKSYFCRLINPNNLSSNF